MTRAYKAKVADGTLHRLFAKLSLHFTSTFLRRPRRSLAVAENRKEQRLRKVATEQELHVCFPQEHEVHCCGCVVLIEMNETQAVGGIIVDYWTSMLDYISRKAFKDAGKQPLRLVWKLYDNAQDALQGLLDGEISTACGRWDPNGIVVFEEREVSRLYMYRVQICPMYLAETFTFRSNFRDMTPFLELMTAVSNGMVRDVVRQRAPSGWLQESCNKTLNDVLLPVATASSARDLVRLPSNRTSRRRPRLCGNCTLRSQTFASMICRKCTTRLSRPGDDVGNFGNACLSKAFIRTHLGGLLLPDIKP